jgi:hypothetical protein
VTKDCKAGLVVALSLFGMAGRVGSATTTARFEVGRWWRYRHEGPRPGSMEPNAIDGERILRVVSVVEEQGAAQWVLEERYTKDPGVIGRLFVGADGLLAALEIENGKGETTRLRYDAPVPYQMTGMEVAEVRMIQATLHVDSPHIALPGTTRVERLEDETLTTPAGVFPGCSHYRSTTRCAVDIKIARIPVVEVRERWYHPAVHGMVKEVYRRSPVRFLTWKRPGYTATSLLTAFGKEQVPSPNEASLRARVERTAPTEARPSPAKAGGLRARGQLLRVALVVPALGLLFWAGRGARKRA